MENVPQLVPKLNQAKQNTPLNSLNMLKADNVKSQSQFDYISWADLCYIVANPLKAKVKTREQAKDNSPVIAAHNANCKTKQAALDHNNFTLLRLDIDDTKLNMAEIDSVLKSHGMESYLIHTTASHQYKGKGNRYRVYIEQGEPLTYAEWANCETYLSSLFFDADDCANRPQQIMFLPFLFKGYEYIQSSGEPITREHPIFTKAQSYVKNLYVEQKQSIDKAYTAEANKSFNEGLVGNQVSIINLIEQAYEWESLLVAQGYKRKGKGWLAPESKSGIAGAYLLQSSDGKTRLYSHHSNDPCCTGKALDKLDFIAIRDFQGHRRNAIKFIAKTYFPEVHRHNLLEFKISKLKEVSQA